MMPNPRVSLLNTERLYHMGPLQQNILKVVSENKEVDYSFIQRILEHKDRIAIMRSVHSLESKKFLRHCQAEPDNPRSKFLFEPTHKGGSLAVLFLGVDLDTFMRVHNPNIFAKLHSDIKDEAFRKKFILNRLKFYVENGLFDSEGYFKPLTSKEAKEATYYFIEQVFKGELSSESIRDFDKIFGREAMLKMKKTYENLYKSSRKILEEFRKLGYD
jgi:hypothetical protein